jgi:peptidylprolyl isomerase
MSVSSLGANLHEALQGSRVGARLLFLEEDDGLPLVLVIDVLPTRASGERVEPRAGLPTVTLSDDGSPVVSIPADTPPPSDLVVQPLIRGTGPQIEVGEVVTVRFTGVAWASGEVFDSTWDTPEGAEAVQSVMIGIGQVIEGWDQGLLEQTVGSQVLLVVPPPLGYGGTSHPLADQTLVYVVDILDAHFQVTEAAAEPTTEGAS